jgi:hypothetical protein
MYSPGVVIVPNPVDVAYVAVVSADVAADVAVEGAAAAADVAGGVLDILGSLF